MYPIAAKFEAYVIDAFYDGDCLSDEIDTNMSQLLKTQTPYYEKALEAILPMVQKRFAPDSIIE